MTQASDRRTTQLDRTTEPSRRLTGRQTAEVPAGHDAILWLQRLAGNQATTALIEAERADAVRHAVDAPGGVALDPRIRAMAQPGIGVDLGAARVKTGPDADLATAAVGASMFTTGTTIVAARGAYDPTSARGQRDVLHETAHIGQQASGPVSGTTTEGGLRVSEPTDRFERAADTFADRTLAGEQPAHAGAAQSAPRAGGPVVQRRMAPSAPLIFEGMAKKQSGAKESRGFFRTPTYQRIEVALRDYVNRQDRADTRWKESKLKYIDEHVAKWLANHGAETTADSVARSAAMGWLAPRIQAEYSSVMKLRSDEQSGSTGTGKGGMNQVDLGVATKRSIGSSKSRTGVFKAPASSYTGGDAPAAMDAGIERDNPRFIERAVASTGVARLAGSTVVAETVAAERNGREGYMMEMATGLQPQGERKVRPKDEAERTSWMSELEFGSEDVLRDEQGVYKTKAAANRLDWDDVRLQEQLIELHLLDAITGQVDRHAGNYFVDQGEGRQTTVKAIDPDLSFGAKKGVAPMLRWNGGTDDKSLKELPPMVTRSQADRVLAITDTDLLGVLGALERDEQQAALVRLHTVKDHIADLEDAGWVLGSLSELSKFTRRALLTKENSYAGRDRQLGQALGFIS